LHHVLYLITYCYVGDGGRDEIRTLLHPPIDTGLWKGVKKGFEDNREILNDTHCVKTISAIDTHVKYLQIIKGFRAATNERGCSLIEIEQFWENDK